MLAIAILFPDAGIVPLSLDVLKLECISMSYKTNGSTNLVMSIRVVKILIDGIFYISTGSLADTVRIALVQVFVA